MMVNESPQRVEWPSAQRRAFVECEHVPTPEQFQAAYATARQCEPQATPHRLLDLVRLILKEMM